MVKALGYAARYTGVPSAAFDCLYASLDTLSPYCTATASLRRYILWYLWCPHGCGTIEGEGSTFLERVQNCANREDLVIRALKELDTGKGLHHEEWQEKDGLTLYSGRVYVPPDGQLRHDCQEWVF